MLKSTSKIMSWVRGLWVGDLRMSARRRVRRLRGLQAEQLEPRVVLSAIVLEIPGVNGDSKAAGATSTDIGITSFSWGFGRDSSGAKAAITDPIVFRDLTFTKPNDSASNALFAQANFGPVNSQAAMLRIVGDSGTSAGKNQFSFNLTNARLTEFGTGDGGNESGALSFSKIDMTESLTATNRTASWNLLTGGAASSPIIGPGNIDTGNSSNPLNIETVLEIGGQKLLIDGFDWNATGSGIVPGPNNAKGSTFNIDRGIDMGTAGLLGSAANGTKFSKVTITDRKEIAGKNRVVMEWNLYDAFISDFGLQVEGQGSGTNSLGWSYSKIEMKVIEFNSKGVAETLRTAWAERDDTGNTVVSFEGGKFGVVEPAILKLENVSFLQFEDLGGIQYETLDWSLAKPVTIGASTNTVGPTTLGALEVNLPAGPSAPNLLFQLALRNFLPKVEHKQADRIDTTSALDSWMILPGTKVGNDDNAIRINTFGISSTGLDDPQMKFSLNTPVVEEGFNDRKIPLITRGNFDVSKQTSTETLSFGERTVNTEFELVVTEVGKVSEIPVKSASWRVDRDASRDGSGLLSTTAPEVGTFDITLDRGLHSPGLFMASARGTEIDNVSLVRYRTVNGLKTVLYRWDMTKAYITSYQNHMLPGTANGGEFDRISLTPSTITLKTDRLDANGNDIGDVGTGWNLKTGKAIAVAGTTIGDFGAIPDGTSNPGGLQVDFPGKNNSLAIESFNWGASLPVGSTTDKGVRPLGDPDISDLVFSLTGRPNPRLLNEALLGKALGTSTDRPALKFPLNQTKSNPSYGFEFPGGVITGYSYSDTEDSSTGATSSASLDAPTSLNASFTPLSGGGAATQSTWNLTSDATTSTGGFGNFVFPTNSQPNLLLEILQGTDRSQVAATGYSFATEHDVNQLVGKSTAPVPLAPRGTAVPDAFIVEIPLNNVTPGLLSAIAGKTVIAEMKIVERGSVTIGGTPQMRPVREWMLTHVLVEQLVGEADAGSPSGSFTLRLNPASAKSTRITYSTNGTPTNSVQTLNFVAPPISNPLGLISGVSTDVPRVINTPARFTDQEAFSTLRYSVSVVSGANVFDSVTLNSVNYLVLDYKAGQNGLAQVRVDARNSFGLVGSLLINVAVDVNGITGAPAGTNLTVSTSEDTPYTITAADFGFTDPNDFPANTFVAVRIASLPSKGSLTLNNVAVTLNQTISIADINAGRFRYTPVANESGNAYASFQFQVQDDGGTANLDLSANTMMFNVTSVNDAPVINPAISEVTMPVIAEDTTNPAGLSLNSLAAMISDAADAGSLRGIAVTDLSNLNGTWQYSLDGSTWLDFGNAVSLTAARVLSINGLSRIRFVPNANFHGSVPLFFHAWDRTVGTAGGTVNASVVGGTTAFSTYFGTVTQTISSVNDAPVLNTDDVSLTVFSEDDLNPAGTLVSALLTGMSDGDAGAVRGMAVRAVEDNSGVWQYTLNSGTTWTAFGGVNDATARLLPADANTRVRFVPSGNFAGTRVIAFTAWDQTSGTAGGTVDLTASGSKGGATAFSEDIAVGRQTVSAVNDAPTLASPTSGTTGVNTPLAFSTGNGNAISVADIDAASGAIQATFTSANGRFTLSPGEGLSFQSGGNGSAAFSVTGSLANINAALEGSTFTSTQNFFDANGAASLQVSISDLGNTGSGGARTVSRTIPISVQALPVAINLGTLDVNNPSSFETGSFAAGPVKNGFYSFTLPTSSNVRIVLSGLSTGGPIVDLFDANNQLLGFRQTVDGSPIDLENYPLAAGTYIIKVASNQEATSFNLSVSTIPLSDDLILNPNVLGTLVAATLPTVRVVDSVSGSLDRQDYHKFTTTVASPLRVNLSGLTDDFDMQLLDARGVVISSSVLELTSIETIARSSLPAGDYFIRIFELPNRNLTDYDLSITVNANSDDSISRPVALGTLNTATLPVVRRTGSVSTTDIQDYYSFILAGQTDVRINLSGLSADIDFRLLDSFGRVITSGAGGSNLTENVFADDLAAGTYFIRVNPFGGAVSNYELAIAIDPVSDDLLTNAVSLGGLSATTPTAQRTGDVNLVADSIDYYSFTLASASDVRINLSGMSSDASIILQDSFGRFISSSNLAGNTIENRSVTALAAGTYHVRVSAVAAATNYVLTVGTVLGSDDLITNATALPTLASGTLPTARTSGVAGGSDIQDYYRFQLNTAGNVRLNLSNMTTDLDVQVLDQFGREIAFGTQSGNTIERVTTPELAVGTYYIRVFQLIGGGPSTNYNLEISTDFNGDDLVRGGNNLGTLASSPLTASGSVGGAADIQDYFSFTLNSTRNVRFLLTGLSADLDVQILDSFGRVVGSSTSGSTSTEDFTLNGLLAGVYYIRIFPYQEAISNYSLSVFGV